MTRLTRNERYRRQFLWPINTNFAIGDGSPDYQKEIDTNNNDYRAEWNSNGWMELEAVSLSAEGLTTIWYHKDTERFIDPTNYEVATRLYIPDANKQINVGLVMNFNEGPGDNDSHGFALTFDAGNNDVEIWRKADAQTSWISKIQFIDTSALSPSFFIDLGAGIPWDVTIIGIRTPDDLTFDFYDHRNKRYYESALTHTLTAQDKIDFAGGNIGIGGPYLDQNQGIMQYSWLRAGGPGSCRWMRGGEG